MKKFFIGILVLIAIGVGIAALTSTIQVYSWMGKTVLMAVSHGQYAQAYDFFSDDFKKQHPLPQFEAMINQDGLNKFKSVEWVKTLEYKDQGVAAILGVVVTTDHQHIPLQIRFKHIRENDDMFSNRWVITGYLVRDAAREGMY